MKLYITDKFNYFVGSLVQGADKNPGLKRRWLLSSSHGGWFDLCQQPTVDMAIDADT